MPRIIMLLLSFGALSGLTACSDAPAAPVARISLAPTQVSSLMWDELAAANTAAKVSNDKLIMMR